MTNTEDFSEQKVQANNILADFYKAKIKAEGIIKDLVESFNYMSEVSKDYKEIKNEDLSKDSSSKH